MRYRDARDTNGTSQAQAVLFLHYANGGYCSLHPSGGGKAKFAQRITSTSIREATSPDGIVASAITSIAQPPTQSGRPNMYATSVAPCAGSMAVHSHIG